MPRSPLPVAEAWDEVHSFLRSRGITVVCGVHLVRLPPVAPDDPRPPWALGPIPCLGLLSTAWAEWLACLCAPVPMDGLWPLTPGDAPTTPDTTQHHPRHTTGAPGDERDSEGRTAWQHTPYTCLTVQPRCQTPMALPQRDNRLHRRYRSSFPPALKEKSRAWWSMLSWPSRQPGSPRRPQAALRCGLPAGAGRTAAPAACSACEAPDAARSCPPEACMAAEASWTAAPASPQACQAPDASQGCPRGGAAAACIGQVAAPATPPARGARAPRAKNTSPGRPQGTAAGGVEKREGATYRARVKPGHTHLNPPKAQLPKRPPAPGAAFARVLMRDATNPRGPPPHHTTAATITTPQLSRRLVQSATRGGKGGHGVVHSAQHEGGGRGE